MMKHNLTPLFMLVFCLLFQIPMKIYSQNTLEENSIPLEHKFYGLSNFWASAKTHFAYFDQVSDLNWDQTYIDYAKELLTVENDLEYYRLLQRFAAELNESHTNVIPPRSMRAVLNARPPIQAEFIEEKAVIVNTISGLESMIPRGSVITSVDGIPTLEYLEENVYPYISAATQNWLERKAVQGSSYHGVGLLYGTPGSEVILEIELPQSGELKTVTLERSSEEILADEWLYEDRTSLPPISFSMTPENIALVAINTFSRAIVRDTFKTYLPQIRKADGIIFDVRKNNGGNSVYGWDIGKHFFEEAVVPNIWKSRITISTYAAWGLFSNNEKYKNHRNGNAWYQKEEFSEVEPAEENIKIPIAVLIGPDTFSAGEDFVAFMKNNRRAIFIGEPTAGSTGQPYLIGIPGGGQASITAKRDIMTDGTEFVGYGIKPDIEIFNSIQSVITERDLVVDRAIEKLMRKKE